MDISDFFDDLNNKRKSNYIKFSADDIVNDMKLMGINKLKKFCKDYNSKELTNFINVFKTNIIKIIKTLEKIEAKNTHMKTVNSCLVVQLQICIDFINEYKKKNSKDKKLNFIKYLNEKEKEINDEIKDSKNAQDTKKNKRRKRSDSKDFDNKCEDCDEEDYDEEDCDDEDCDEDCDEECDEEYDDRDDDDDDRDDDDDDIDEEDDDIIDSRKIQSNMKKNLRNSKNKDFMNEIIKSNLTDSNTQLFSYFGSLNTKDKNKSLKMLKEVNGYYSNDKPLLFKIIMLDMPLSQKNYILKKYLNLVATKGESSKLKNWIESVMSIPFGIYKGLNISSFDTNQIKTFLNNLQKTMDNVVWGHDDAKRHIIQIMGQKFRNPNAKGSMIGIWGPPGNGKTSLVKEGIAKAMDKPFIFISLGGATDSSFLEGHSYTYEGSIYGRIANGIIASKCMDPIIYFDELDKISQTAKGEEITNLLIHLTDPVQNGHFRDKYFHGIDFDLSRATMIFSFNNPSLVDKVLLDRITTVETKYLLTNQKIHIAKNYLIPEILKEVGLNKGDIIINDNLIKTIVEKYSNEGGVRKLKSLLYNIVRELNISNLTKNKIDNKNIIFPYIVSEQNIKTLFKNKYENQFDKINKINKIGIVNGLYATTSGIGGVLPIETLWIPTNNPLEIKATGHLEQVIKESTQVACSLAWNLLDSNKQNELLTKWKDKPMGFHLHCPDGSTPKDGPSAGAALTLALYSMFTEKKIKYDVALTGEINLQGNVTAIGGLEEKMEGAKKAGVKLVLYPKENQKDVDKIKERNKDLFDSNFKIKSVDTIYDVIQNAIVE